MITREQVRAAMTVIKSAADSEFFFDSLKSPDWIQPLIAEQLFAKPPGAVHENNLVGFPFWPQSRYLKRMAPLAPEDVLAAIEAIPATDNVRVREDLADAALEMPAALAARLLPRLTEWAASPYQLLLPEKLGALIAHLARGGEGDSALALTRAVLAVNADPRYKAERSPYGLPPDAEGRFHEWEYGRILEQHVPALVEATGERAVVLLCDLLDSAVTISSREREDAEDYSYIWRTAIEEHPLNKEHEHGVRDHLVSALRDAAVSVARQDPSALARLLTDLESRRWKVFQRIALHVLRQSVTGNAGLVRERLLDAKRAEDLGQFHEFWLLARAGLPGLDATDQDAFFAHMDEKLREDETVAAQEEDTEKREDERRQARVWMYRRLSILDGVLPPAREEQFRALRQEFGPIEHPDLLAYSLGASWVGPSSPKSTEDLSAMSITDLTAFLREWPGEGRRDEPSPEGLGRTLTGIVAATPERYAAEAESFQHLDPTYVRAVVSGLEEALKAKRTFIWEPVLNLCTWVVRQPREVTGRSESDDHLDEVDPSWGWARRSIAGLLATGFGSSDGGVPSGLRQVAWNVIEPLTRDPDPTPAHEDRYGGKNMDPATLSINTVRGEAMHSVVQYGLWVRRQLEADTTAADRLARGFAEMPEVRDVLDLHLNPERDPSAAIRSVYGQWFAWLHLLDPRWAAASIARVFPSDPAAAHLREAAWNAYLFFGGTYDNIFDVLRDQYAHAIELIGRGPRDRGSDRPDNRLAEHLMVFYWRGKLPLSEADGLIRRFYGSAPAELRGHSLGFVGRTLRHEDAPSMPDAVRFRLQELLEWRIGEASNAGAEDRAAELSDSGWWFASRKFPALWILDRLVDVLRLARRVEDSGEVVEALAALVNEFPEKVIDVLTLMVEGKDEWGYSLWLSKVEPILHAALDSGQGQAREKAIDLIHVFGAKGIRQFETLLPEQSQ